MHRSGIAVSKCEELVSLGYLVSLKPARILRVREVFFCREPAAVKVRIGSKTSAAFHVIIGF